MPAAAWQRFIELGHEGGDDAVLFCDLFYTAFKQYSPVCSFHYF